MILNVEQRSSGGPRSGSGAQVEIDITSWGWISFEGSLEDIGSIFMSSNGDSGKS